MRRVALAVWVKTPGVSPLKTRLAADIGRDRAEAIYSVCLEATGAVVDAAVRRQPALRPCWAIAESRSLADPRWSGWPRLTQGEGTLGERLDRVYRELLASHDAVLFVGADAPQVTPGQLEEAAARLLGDAHEFLIGPAVDGGFWLFGGRQPLPSTVWTEVTYSANDTAQCLIERLATHGPVGMLDTLRDLDHASDLGPLAAALDALGDPLPAQRALGRLLVSWP